ncbi:MAG: cyclodeaminase/cyclohydrolase family protein [Leptolinea sp.]
METFLKVLDPEDTSTGGGSASAIAGAMAGALVAMAARLSDTNQGGADKQYYDRISAQASQISQQLLDGSQQDALAFQLVRNAYQLSHETDEGKLIRQQAIQSAWLKAASVPLENAEGCMQVYELGEELAGCVNPKVLSDLRCGLLLARAGLLGCLENIYINLPSLKDANVAGQLAEKASILSKRFSNLELSSGINLPKE